MRLGELNSYADDKETLVVHAAIVSDFLPFIDPELPFCWILGHVPHRTVEWWSTSVPLNDKDFLTAPVRMLAYDLQLSSIDFVKHIRAFDNHGILLYQSNKPMPDTLFPDSLKGPNRDQVLRQNGVQLSVDLPHAIETAVITSYRAGYLTSRLQGDPT